MAQQVSFLFNGKNYQLKPDFDGMDAIEKALSLTMLELAKKLTDGVLSLHELMVIFQHSLELEARGLDVKEVILVSGISYSTQMVTAMFADIFQGCREMQAITVQELAEMIEACPD